MNNHETKEEKGLLETVRERGDKVSEIIPLLDGLTIQEVIGIIEAVKIRLFNNIRVKV